MTATVELLRGRRLWLMICALMVAEFAGTYETAMIYAALPRLFTIFGDVVGVTWLVTIYMVAGSMFAVFSSRFGDLFGRTQMLIAVLAIILAGSLISAFATSLPGIIAGRALQGASAAILPLCYGIARERVEPARVPFIVGVLTGAASVGAGVGLMVGALLVDSLHWKSIFIFSAGFAAVTILTIFLGVPRSRPARRSWKNLDLVGGLLFGPALLGLLLVLTEGGKWGLTSPLTLGLAAVSVALMAVWVTHERRHPDPLIDVRLLGRRPILLTNLIMALAAVGAYQVTQIISILLQQPVWTGIGLGVSATVVGLIKLPANLAGLFGSLLSGKITERRDGRTSAIAGSLILAAGWGYLFLRHGSVLDVFIAIVMTGFGLQMLYAAMSNLVIAAAPADRTSEAVGLTTVIRAGTSALGSQLVALTLASAMVRNAEGTALPAPSAFLMLFGWVAATSLSCAFVAMLLPRRPETRPSPVSAAPDAAAETAQSAS